MPPPMPPPDDHESASLMNDDPGSMPPDPNAPPPDAGPDAGPGGDFESILVVKKTEGGFAVTVTKAGGKPGDPSTSDNANVATMDDIVKYITSDLAGGAPAGGPGAPGGGMPPQA